MTYRRIMVLVMACTVVLFGEQAPKIGAEMNRKWIQGDGHNLCMTHPAQLDPCVQQLFDGVRYTIGYSKETRRVTYLYTDDKNFRTADGLKVGDSIPISDDSVRALPGWHVEAPITRDGWRPILGYDQKIKLRDGTVLNLRDKDSKKSGTAIILGFCKLRN